PCCTAERTARLPVTVGGPGRALPPGSRGVNQTRGVSEMYARMIRLLLAAAALMVAAPAFAQSYDPSIGSGNISASPEASPGYYYGGRGAYYGGRGAFAREFYAPRSYRYGRRHHRTYR